MKNIIKTLNFLSVFIYTKDQINLFKNIKKTSINVAILLLLFTTSLYSQDNYSFIGLGADDSGGTGFKSISTASILVTSNNSTGTNPNTSSVGAELFSTSTTSGGTATITLKADGVNATSFDVDAIEIDFSSLSGATTVGLTGGSSAHDNIQPSLVMNYIICTNGIYPARN